ncbi:large ribosomal subunit protein bL19cy-like [Malania oleifera]|uniref:large ribosomal subunit protein bL19cy-like n=1 Tax=Malania oleifera TaxID=397392 RepID=UPI0025AE113B|nr:large ribosomal subunit protein bL19cy-like [Malania oleifera]
MGSHVLPQALYMIPKNPTCCPVKKLGFSSVLTSFNSCRVSVPRVSTHPFGFQFNSIVAVRPRRSFVSRAEGEAEGELGESVNEEEEVVETVDAEASEGEGERETEAEVISDEPAKPPRKRRIKLGEIMGILNKRAVEAAEKVRPVPDLRTGDIVEIKVEVPENRRRLANYKGIVMSKQNAGIHTTIRIRRIVAGIGVEIVFPVYSPCIKEIKVVKHRKVRRARLYYLRDKLPRFSTFK